MIAGCWAGIGTAAALAAGGVLQVEHMRRIARDPEREVLENTPKGRARRVRSADGTILHAEVFGPEDGETVVLAHGWTEALRFWTYVIRGLEQAGLRAVAYDLRGHGDSEPAKHGDYAIPRFGEDLEAVLAACVPDGSRALVAGHSLGAMSIASWAEKHDVQTPGTRGGPAQHRRQQPDHRQPSPASPGHRPGAQPDDRRARVPRQQGAVAALLDAGQLGGDPLHRVRS